ncbi:unnamed protein product [Adineta steineri]|uniref:Uncharacterized protein n=1 Tax=Adineta steineri TaxID=433720 RepID=A0A814DEB2_9BILA|nr:unnamed protein product [Adineta steineri]CAF1381608.1 unnamed protein product [Adineta steineri]
MGLFGNKREKGDKIDKYEYHSTTKGGRSGGYGPPALSGTPPSPYYPTGAAAYFDGYGQVAPQGKPSKYGKYNGAVSKSLYGGDPMQQAMLLPPQSPAAVQAQAAAMMQMQQYMQGQGGAQFGGILPPIQMPLSAAQQAGLLPAQAQQFYGYSGQPTATPYYDPSNPAFQQQGAFAPYQQPNFYDPNAGTGFTGPYGYMPAAY